MYFVNCNGIKSKNFIASSGVSQDSVLGPLFFNIFINDVYDFEMKYIVNVDNLNLFHTINSISNCLTLQSRGGKVSQWCQSNYLFTNIKTVSYTSIKKLNTNPH